MCRLHERNRPWGQTLCPPPRCCRTPSQPLLSDSIAAAVQGVEGQVSCTKGLR